MRMIGLVAGATALALSAILSVAVAAPCDQAQTQLALNQCYGKLANAADAELNRLYKQLMAKADPTERHALRDAQRAWIAFRDKECNYETIEEAGGSIRPMEYSICVARLTNARVADFKSFVACSPSDLACPADTGK